MLTSLLLHFSSSMICIRKNFLVCSSVLALSAPALAQDGREPLWEPVIDFTLKSGDERTLGTVSLMAPLAQDEKTLVFADIRTVVSDQDTFEGNVGIGIRNIAGPVITGAYGFWDTRMSEHDNVFQQITAGAEVIGEKWEARANLYTPVGEEEKLAYTDPTTVSLSGTRLFLQDGRVFETALQGFDVEFGRALPILENARAYLGYYRFHGDNVADVNGYRARIEADIGDWVEIGAERQFSDTERGNAVFGEIRVRYPFGGWTKGSERRKGMSPLQRRMMSPVVRDIDIVTTAKPKADPVPAETVNGEDANIYFVDNTAAAGGDGSREHPFNTLAGAQGAAGAYDTIYVLEGDGTTTSQDAGITLDDEGQRLLGSGVSLTLDASRIRIPEGVARPADLDNLVLVPAAANPVITNTGGDGITVSADNVEVAGLTVDGAAQDGIAITADGAAQSAMNVSVSDVTVTGNRMGLYIYGADGGAVSAKVERTIAIANTQHGIAVYDDTDDTFEADLGGGNLGSAGLNVLTGNTLEDLAVDYDGRTLSAMNTWWGQVAGPDTDDPSVGIAPQIYYGAPINDGLVGHWTFDSEWTSNTTAYDRSGNNNDGTLSGEQGLPTATTGFWGEALYFAGDPDGNGGLKGSYVTVPTSPELNPTDEITLLGFGQKSVGTGAGYNITLIRASASEYDVTVHSATKVRLSINSDYNPAFPGYNDDGSWNFLAGTFDGATKRVFIDAGEIGNSAKAGGINDNNSAIRIGTRNDLFANYWTGGIDDVRIYSRALDPAEIAELYRMDASSAVDTSGFLTADPR